MPYNPGISYRGDQYLFDAIGGLGQDVSDALKKRDELQKTDAYNDMVMQHAYEKGDVTEEDMNKYLSASHSAKTGIAAGHAANIVNDWKQQSQQEEQQLRDLQIQDLTSKTNETGPYAPNPNANQKIWDSQGNEVGIYDGNGTPHYYPAGAAGSQDEAVVTDPLKINDREIPGIGVNRKTGQYVYFGESGMERDPKTGALGTRDTKGNFKPVNAQQVAAMAMDPNNPVQQTAPNQPPSPEFLSKAWSAITGGGSPAAPSAAQQSGAVKVNSKADYDALPSGSLYIAPDGSTRRKP